MAIRGRKISNGPSLFDLGIALIRGDKNNRKPIEFSYQAEDTLVTLRDKFIIDSLERFDQTDKNWEFEGRLVRGPNFNAISGMYIPSTQLGYVIIGVRPIPIDMTRAPHPIYSVHTKLDFLTALFAGNEELTRESLSIVYGDPEIDHKTQTTLRIKKLGRYAGSDTVMFFEGAQVNGDQRKVQGTYSLIDLTGEIRFLT